jgi:predicted TIM-barrel fold metal-dependent hydrolase
MMPIVDTHQHLWDLARIRPPWLKPGSPLARDFVTKDYLEATRGLNVVKAVYMEVAVADADLVAEAEYVIGLCRRDDNPTVAAVIGGRPASDGFAHYIRRFKDSPYVKGVRQIVGRGKRETHPCLDPAFVRGVRLLGQLGMSFDLCVGAAELLDGANLVGQCPDTRFIVDHCGNADPNAFRAGDAPRSHDPDLWRKGVDALAGTPNTVCKISGIVARMERGKWAAEDLAPVVDHCLDAFGPDRVLFASDWPVCTRGAALREWVAALKQIVSARPRANQRKLFHDNAVRFYGLGE